MDSRNFPMKPSLLLLAAAAAVAVLVLRSSSVSDSRRLPVRSKAARKLNSAAINASDPPSYYPSHA
jgi:hypothetical protein